MTLLNKPFLGPLFGRFGVAAKVGIAAKERRERKKEEGLLRLGWGVGGWRVG